VCLSGRDLRGHPICVAVEPTPLTARSLDEIAVDHPEIKIAVLRNLSLDLAQKLRQANQLIGVLAA
jgi:hypothetical protein